MSVNADKLVQIVPRIIEGGTPGLTFAGLLLTQSVLPPSGRVLQFSSAQAVAAYFGSESSEAALAATYFNGYVNTDSLPSKLFIAPYQVEAAAAWLRGAAYSGTLDTLKTAGIGGFTVTINGTTAALENLSFAAATSFSDVAGTIQTALSATVEGVTVAYSSLTKAWQITSPTTGAESTITYAVPPTTGVDLGTLLGLTEQAGAVVSPGLDAQTLPDCMTNILGYARDWVTFGTVWEPALADKLALAQWCAGYDTRFCYVMWDTDNAAQVAGSTASAGYQIDTVLELDGTAPVFNTAQLMAWTMGTAACINFDEYNGRLTFAFKQGEGLLVTCDNDESYDALLANGYNCYADFATASSQFKFFQPGQVSGKWDWLDTYLNAIAIKDGLQLNLLDLFKAVKSIPYNEDGYAMVRTACLDTITRFLNFGAIRAGITLSQTQKVQLLAEIGKDVSKTIESQGWYMQVQDPGATVRAQRGTPDCKFYYTDGGSIQKIVLPSTAIQ